MTTFNLYFLCLICLIIGIGCSEFGDGMPLDALWCWLTSSPSALHNETLMSINKLDVFFSKHDMFKLAGDDFRCQEGGTDDCSFCNQV